LAAESVGLGNESDRMIVMKFGGSSVGSAEGIRRVIALVRRELPRRPLVVVSAMGKTTRHLAAAAEAAAAGNLALAREGTVRLRAFHQREAAPVVPAGSLDALFAERFAELDRVLAEIARAGALSPRAADRVASFGELLSSAVLAQALAADGIKAACLDCRQLLVTDDLFTRANPDYAATAERLAAAVPPLLATGRVPIVGGYVGATAGGVTTTLGYEGSDFSAAIFGAALGAEEVQIWTDVDGILTADPALVPEARPVAALTFGEALELACSGSKKPHPGTLGPASRAGVPIRILNSRRPEAPGTRIGPRTGPSTDSDRGAAPAIRSIACRRHDHLLYATPRSRSGGGHAENGFLPALLDRCARLRPALLVLGGLDGVGGIGGIGVGGASVPLALDRAERLAEVQAALGEAAAEVGVVPGRTVVSILSDDLATSPELAARALAAAAEWEPRLVLDGAAAPCVRFLVGDRDAAAAVAAVHARLFGGEEIR
jgi:aspartate kinase